MPHFQLISSFKPQGDQPQAIKRLTEGLEKNKKWQTLLGVTGSGKTFVISHVIANVNRPTLVITHNKTLAAQLYQEFKGFFPNNSIQFFVSYYDYYQPEAYIIQSDKYIEKETDINEEIDRLRNSATRSLLERRDVIVIASVSCIYGLGSPEHYRALSVTVEKGMQIERNDLIAKLVDIQYTRNDIAPKRGNIRARGDTIEVYPTYDNIKIRIELFDNVIDRIIQMESFIGQDQEERERICIFPAKHYVTPQESIERAIESIEVELEERLKELNAKGKLLEAQRLKQRTSFDLEMIRETGYTQGIENYSRHFDQREPGEPPSTLLDFFPEDFLLVIDESHATIPQVRGMYEGDKARKKTLVEYGFRLPSARDNRPLTYAEFEAHLNRVVCMSATPRQYERQKSSQIVEMIIRPTFLVDPNVVVRPAQVQFDDLVHELHQVSENGDRALVTTITKRDSEKLATYLGELGMRVKYLHSEIDTLERVEILQELRLGKFDILVGVNLLREGLDLPEVTLVAILDADRAGFLRTETALIQTIGRTARNVRGQVILYADEHTPAIKETLSETNRRRKLQLEYNRKHSIEPKSIEKEVRQVSLRRKIDDEDITDQFPEVADEELVEHIDLLEEQMRLAAENLEFERAAKLRDRIRELSTQQK